VIGNAEAEAVGAGDLAQVRTMSRLGPTRVEFQLWWVEAKLSKLSWWLASETKYFAPAAV